MTRVFRRGELQSAILDALAKIEPANGYAIMQQLAEEIGGVWKPSPGAIYPALINLADQQLVSGQPDDDNVVTYRLTELGRAKASRSGNTLAAVRRRSATIEVEPTLGAVLDGFAASALQRHRRISASSLGEVEALLARTVLDLNRLLDKEPTDG